jgi:DnaJ-class molecular chaperone
LREDKLHLVSSSNYKHSNIILPSCPKCGGKGKTINKHCHVCHGSKIVKGLEELTVYIEKGMPNGHEIVKITNPDF